MAQLTPQQILDINDAFLALALERNYTVASEAIPTNGTRTITLDIPELPGWVRSVDLAVVLPLAITVASGGTVPDSWSDFFPWNCFETVAVSLGGGPFINVSPYLFYLREFYTNPGYLPGGGGSAYPYVENVAWSVPSTPQATVGSTVENVLRFGIRVPLQIEDNSTRGIIPVGSSKYTCKIRMTLAANLYGDDQFLNPVVGGTDVSVAIGTSVAGTITPEISYYTTPISGNKVQNPIIQYVMNIQQAVTKPNAAGSKTPIPFKDPYLFNRFTILWENGNGNPSTSEVESIELDLMPSYPQYIYDTPGGIQAYLNRMAKLYKGYLPEGTFVFDLISGNDPTRPNGTQQIDGELYQTLQAQLAVAQGTNVSSPAKIVSFVEAESAVGF